MTVFRIALLAALLCAAALPIKAADDAASAPPLRAGIERIKALRAQRPGDGSLVYY